MTRARDLADLAPNAEGLSVVTVSDITDLSASATELNLLDGVTATTAEINYLDGVTSSIQTQLDNAGGITTGKSIAMAIVFGG